jgi:hypothetical protein
VEGVCGCLEDGLKHKRKDWLVFYFVQNGE